MSRKFGRQIYRLHSDCLSKRDAQIVARRLRKQGRLARVVKATSFWLTDEYDVYEALPKDDRR